MYHYTTTEGVRGIVSQNELWATNACFLNDPSEIKYGVDMVDKGLKGASITLMNSLYGNEVSEKIAARLQSFRKSHHLYVTCFCEEGDLLGQWRGYGDKCGGFSVGFSLKEENLQNPSTQFLQEKFYMTKNNNWNLLEELPVPIKVGWIKTRGLQNILRVTLNLCFGQVCLNAHYLLKTMLLKRRKSGD